MYADLILKNGQIISLDDSMHQYEAIAVKQGRIIALGSNEKVSSLVNNDTKKINLKGKTVIPGFVDGHQHMIKTGFKLLYVDCDKKSISEVVTAIKKKASKSNKNDWIIGVGFDDSKFKEKRMLHKEDLSEVINPVFIYHYSNHHAVANDRALELAGIKNSTKDPESGKIEKDSFNELTGVLIEKGMDPVKSVIPPVTNEELKEAIILANNHYISQGITGVHEAGIGLMTGSLREFQVYQELRKDNQIDIRIYAMFLDSFFEEISNMHLLGGYGDEMLKIGSIKLFIDGTLSGKTSATSEDYIGENAGRGIWMMDINELEEKVIRAHKLGYQVAVHAIGDEGVRAVLNAIEKAQKKYPRDDCRHRIEHAGIMNNELIKKMKELNVIPVPQPAFIYLNGDVYLKVLHPKLKNNLYRSKSFFDEGLVPVGSSDAPVISSSVMLGIYSLMSRKTTSGEVISPEESLPLVDALKMYTRNPAYSSFQEDEVGTLEIGKRGDLTILPSGFMNFTEEQVKNTLIEMTIIGGKIVYQNTQVENM